MGGGIVFAAYRRPDLAHRHALCLTGVTVTTVDLDKIAPDLRAAIEVFDKLHADITAEIAMDWEHDDDVTPTLDATTGAETRTKTKESPPLVIEVAAIDDAPDAPDDDPKDKG
jgi:hypothetical protein